MWTCKGVLVNRWGLLRSVNRAWMAVCLVFLLGVGEPFNVGGLVHVQRLLVASGSVPSSEEATDAELATPHSCTSARLTRKKASVPRRSVRTERHDPLTRLPVLFRLSPRQPDLPCGAIIPIRC